MSKCKELIGIYKIMSDEDLQKEIDGIFDMVYAMLEATESESIEIYLTPIIKLKISCEVMKGNDGKYYN